MAQIRRLILDVMKPFEPSIIQYANKLTELASVESVNIVVIEIDKEIENVKITLEGSKLDYEEIQAAIKNLAGAIHSIDMVVAGKNMIETPLTPQDE